MSFLEDLIQYLQAQGAEKKLVIPPPLILWKGQGGGILLLRYSVICDSVSVTST